MSKGALEHVSENQYLECVLYESVTEETEDRRKEASRRRVAGAIRSLVMLGICSFKWARFLHENCLYLFLCKAMRQCYERRRESIELGM